VSSRALLDACARLGLNTTQILQAANVDPATLANPDARIPIEQVDELWRKAYQLARDPDLALHAIEVLPFGAYRVIDFLASNAPTVGAAIAKVSDYFPLINDTVSLPYTTSAGHVTVSLTAPLRPATITRPYAEYTLAAVFLRTRIATNQRYPLMRVDFSHPRPDDIREHERIFECPVVFGAGGCRLVIARVVWDTPRTGSDPALFDVLDTHARMLLEQRPVDEPSHPSKKTPRTGHPLQRPARRNALSRGEGVSGAGRHRRRRSRLPPRVCRAELLRSGFQTLVGRLDTHRIPPNRRLAAEPRIVAERQHGVVSRQATQAVSFLTSDPTKEVL
jgi:hypothetical protein